METYLDALDLWKAIEEDYAVQPLLANPTMAQIKTQKERRTRKSKAKGCLFAAVSPTIFKESCPSKKPRLFGTLSRSMLEMNELKECKS